MELVQGLSLAELIGRDGALAGPRAAGIGLQLLEVLQVAHGLGIVHRDIKPANIMITAAGQVKLTDFGIVHTAGDTRLTRSGVMGTEAYMAPELFETGELTAAADVWSVGATLFYAVAGRGAFVRDNTGATLRAILLEEIPVPPCEPRLAAAISGMLQRDPGRRASIEQARADLQQAAAAEPAPPPETPEAPPEPPGPGSGPGPGPGWDRRTTRQARVRVPDPRPTSGPRGNAWPVPGDVSRRAIAIGVGAVVVVAVAAGLSGELLADRHSSGPRLKLRKTITPADDLASFALSPSGTVLATYGGPLYGGPVILWNTGDGQEIASLPYRDPNDVAFSPDGQLLAIADSKDRMDLWSIPGRRTVKRIGNIVADAVAFNNQRRAR